jgi:AcrR family transcriptional regulator
MMDNVQLSWTSYNAAVVSSRTRGQRAGLTRERVLAGARELLAERGVAALTMRALAERLDVRPNALYSHVDGKAGLVDDLLDDALARIPVPHPGPREPSDGMCELMSATYDALLEQADLLPLYLARRGARGAHARRLGDVLLALLADAGLPPARADEAVHVLVVHTIGSAAFATGSPLAADHGGTDHRATFEQGLRWLIAGITGAGRA